MELQRLSGSQFAKLRTEHLKEQYLKGKISLQFLVSRVLQYGKLTAIASVTESEQNKYLSDDGI